MLHLFACSLGPLSQGDPSSWFLFAAPGVTGRSVTLVRLFAGPVVTERPLKLVLVRGARCHRAKCYSRLLVRGARCHGAIPTVGSCSRRPVSQGEVLHLFACSLGPLSQGDPSSWFLFAAPGVTGRFLLLVLVRGAWCHRAKSYTCLLVRGTRCHRVMPPFVACLRRPVSQGEVLHLFACSRRSLQCHKEMLPFLRLVCGARCEKYTPTPYQLATHNLTDLLGFLRHVILVTPGFTRRHVNSEVCSGGLAKLLQCNKDITCSWAVTCS